MNHVSSVLCSAAALSFFAVSCGGSARADQASGGQPKPLAPAPAAPTPAVPTPSAQEPAKQEPSAAATTAPTPAKKPTPAPKIDYAMVTRLFGNDPTSPAVDNPATPEKVALGKALYHEQGLSKNGNLSCASCHDLANYGVDHKATSPGSDGKVGERNTPTTYNAFRQFAQFWDGRAATVEDQALVPVLNPIEHGVADETELVAKIRAKPELVAGFAKAFPGDSDPVTPKNFGLAIGAFERTLVTKSRWDEYLDGNRRALTNEELAGLKTFMDVGCTTCHVNRTLGGHMFQKVGLLRPYPTEDIGRMKVTNSEADKFVFKVPTLLNVDKTAPYYHDGKIATLEEAVKDMAQLQLARDLTDDQIAAIVAFLKSTTGPLPAEFASAK